MKTGAATDKLRKFLESWPEGYPYGYVEIHEGMGRIAELARLMAEAAREWVGPVKAKGFKKK